MSNGCLAVAGDYFGERKGYSENEGQRTDLSELVDTERPIAPVAPSRTAERFQRARSPFFFMELNQARQCACVHHDANECARIRDGNHDIDDDDYRKRECECCCHDDEDYEPDDL